MTALCVIYANCQGDILRQILQQTKSFNDKFHIHLYTNYICQPINEEDFKKCALFLYQKLDSHWGEFSSDNLLSKLNQHCQIIQIPNMFFKGYWPFWTNKTTIIDFANSLIEKLLKLKLSTEEILKIYLNGIHPDFLTIYKIAKESINIEIEKEKTSDIKYVHIIKEFWKQEHLFYTVNHPAKKLILRSEEADKDLYAAIDKVTDKLERRIRKNKTRNMRTKEAIAFVEFETTEEEDKEEKIVKRKTINLKPMNEEEAILQMNLLGHEFFIFENSDTDGKSLLYKREDGNYGIIDID